jgi:hypothetical protein
VDWLKNLVNLDKTFLEISMKIMNNLLELLKDKMKI